jgi:hypothetical protein
MANEVHVTTSQADAAKMIVERNSANGKPTPDAIRKIAEAQAEPPPSAGGLRQTSAILSGQAKSRLRALVARMSFRKIGDREG